MPTTTYSGLEDSTQMWYDKVLLVRALPNLLHDKFGQRRPLPARNTKTIKFRRHNALAVATTPLVEGVTPVGSTGSITDLSATVSQYGDFLTVSDIASWTSRDPVLTEFAEILGEQGGQTVDQVWRDIIVAGTNVLVATDDVGGTSATRADCDGLINDLFLRKVIRALKNQNAKFFTKLIRASTGVGTTPIRPAYWMITGPYTELSIEGITGFVPRSDYPSALDAMDPFEIGAFKNLRIVSTTHQKVFLDAGNTIVAGHKSNLAANDDVHVNLCFGENAYGIVPLTGHAMENIVKPLGAGDDPLNQRATTGWKAATTAKILNDAFMMRAETSVLA